jgi:hypothetical protein
VTTTGTVNPFYALGLAGYLAYAEHVGWRYYEGSAMPVWSELPERTREAWIEAARAIVEAGD